MKEPKTELGSLLYNYRKSHNLTLARLADLINVSIQYISNIESGRCSISAEHVRVLGAVTGIKQRDLAKAALRARGHGTAELLAMLDNEAA